MSRDRRERPTDLDSEPLRDPARLRRRILRIVALNTGGLQPKTISRESLLTLFTYANFDGYAARKVLSELVADDAIIDENGRFRPGPR